MSNTASDETPFDYIDSADFKTGVEVGRALAEGAIGEHTWHIVNAAISAMEAGKELQGLMLLRTLRFYLSAVTGHDTPPLY